MPKQINLKGEIGWDITSESIDRQLRSAGGQDIEVIVASPGGLVYEGLKIFNSFKNYAGNVTFRLSGLVASMASYIVLSRGTDNVIVEPNAVYMIHNVSGGAWGDYRALNKTAQLVEDLTNHLGSVYSKAVGIPMDQVRKLLDDESYFYGAEIVETGFGSELIESEESEGDKESFLTTARVAVAEIVAKIKDVELTGEEVDAMINMVAKPKTPEPKAVVTVQEKPKEGGKLMTLEEMKVKHPELHASLLAQGKAEGVEAERARVNQITSYRTKLPANAQAVVDNAIANGDDFPKFSLDVSVTLNTNKEVAASPGVDTPVGGDVIAPVSSIVADGNIDSPEKLTGASNDIAALIGLKPVEVN